MAAGPLPRPEPKWLALEAVYAFHSVSLARFGGAPGLRDRNLLESALARPRHLFVYEPEVNLHRLAAAYAFGIAKNHPFLDGNKRTAFLCVYVFLRENGWRINAPQADLVIAMLSVADGSQAEDAFTGWLARNSTAGIS